MARQRLLPEVPQTLLTTLAWESPVGVIRIERGLASRLADVDSQWLGLGNRNDPTAAWQWLQLGKGKKERYVIYDASDRVQAAWIDHDTLVSGDAYRLDFFKVRPDHTGRGLGRLVLGMIARRAKELGAKRIVFQAIPTSESYFKEKLGATACPDWKGGARHPNWNGGAPLPSLQLIGDKLTDLEKELDDQQVDNSQG